MPQNPFLLRQLEIEGELPIESLIVGKFPFADIRRYGGSFEAAIVDIGFTQLKTLVVSTQVYLKSNVTIPSNISVQVYRGGRIYLGNYDFACDGPFFASLARVFYETGTGKVVRLFVEKSYPEWWGIDGIADEVEINKAIVVANGITSVQLLGKTYVTADSIVPVRYTHLYGVGNRKTIIDSTSTNPVIDLRNTGGVNGSNTVLKDFAIFGDDSASGHGIQMGSAAAIIGQVTLERLWIGVNGSGNNIGINVLGLWDSDIKNCMIEYNRGRGIYLADVNSTSTTIKIKGCGIQGNGGKGIENIAGSNIVSVSIEDTWLQNNTTTDIDINAGRLWRLANVYFEHTTGYNAIDISVASLITIDTAYFNGPAACIIDSGAFNGLTIRNCQSINETASVVIDGGADAKNLIMEGNDWTVAPSISALAYSVINDDWADTITNRIGWGSAGYTHIGNGGIKIRTIHSGTALLNFPNIAAGGIAELTIPTNYCSDNDTVMLGPPKAIETGLIWSGFVSADHTVKIRLHNITAGAIDPASATWRVLVIRF